MKVPLALFLLSLIPLGAQEGGSNFQTPQPSTYIADLPEIPQFTPPAPEVPKEVPDMRVDSAVTLPTEASRTVTLLRAEASTAPDLPVVVEPVQEAAGPGLSEQEKAARELYHRRHNLAFGATVHDHQVSVVRWQHPDTGESYEAVCGFDIGLLAGIGQFVHAQETYDFMLIHTHVSTSDPRRFAGLGAYQVPEVAAGAVYFTKGNAQDVVGTAPIQLIRELLASETSRLIPFQAARDNYLAASAAWQAAHPKVPKNETFWLKPHRGSRYLADPRPELPVSTEPAVK